MVLVHEEAGLGVFSGFRVTVLLIVISIFHCFLTITFRSVLIFWAIRDRFSVYKATFLSTIFPKLGGGQYSAHRHLTDILPGDTLL